MLSYPLTDGVAKHYCIQPEKQRVKKRPRSTKLTRPRQPRGWEKFAFVGLLKGNKYNNFLIYNSLYLQLVQTYECEKYLNIYLICVFCFAIIFRSKIINSIFQVAKRIRTKLD